VDRGERPAEDDEGNGPSTLFSLGGVSGMGLPKKAGKREKETAPDRRGRSCGPPPPHAEYHRRNKGKGENRKSCRRKKDEIKTLVLLFL